MLTVTLPNSRRILTRVAPIVAGAALAAAAWQLSPMFQSEAASIPPLSENPVEAARLAFPDDGTDYQAAILADGAVTDAEHATALEAALVCMEDAGLTVIRPGSPDLAGGALYGFRAPPDRPDLAASQEDLADSCLGQYFTQVSYARAAQSALSPEEVAAYHERLAACLRANGAEFEGDLDAEEFTAWMDSGPEAQTIGRECVKSSSPRRPG